MALRYEFRAGKMNMVDGKVKPDSRKGKVQIIQEGDAKIFQWLENGKTDPEISGIFRKVKQSSDRVYLFKIKDSPERVFLWLQDPDLSKDNELESRVNTLFDEEEAGVDIESFQSGYDPSSAPLQAAPGDLANANPQQLADALANMLQPGGARDLNELMREAFGEGRAEEFMGAMGQQTAKKAKRSAPLEEMITSEVLKEMEENEEFQQALIPHLPPEQQNLEDYKETIHSAQLLQALRLLNQACESENLEYLLMSFGLDYTAVKGARDGTDLMLQALLHKFPNNHFLQWPYCIIWGFDR